MKRALRIAAVLIIALGLFLSGIVIKNNTLADAAPVDEPSNAIFVSDVWIDETDGGKNVSFTFNKAAADCAADVTQTQGQYIIINGTALNSVSGAALGYSDVSLSGVPDYKLKAFLPSGTLNNGTNNIDIEKGFVSALGDTVTVKHMYKFNSPAGAGTRVYRSGDLSGYDAVTVTSVSVPEIQSSNFVFYIYFSGPITSRKLIDLQVRTPAALKGYHGETGDGQYSNAEIDLYDSYGIIGYTNPQSILYNLQYGCKSFNSLQAFPGNNNGILYDMTPKNKLAGIDVYTVYQIQEQVADPSLYYINKAGATVGNGSSLQPLSVQLHLDANHIQFVMKGDSTRDKDMTAVLDAKGTSMGKTSFNENIAPSSREDMALTLKSGLMFPNGKVIKEDVSFTYNGAKKTWMAAGASPQEKVADDTLSNQEGYSAEELEALNPPSDKAGCEAAAGVRGAVAFMLTSFFAALLFAKGRKAAIRGTEKKGGGSDEI